MKITRRQFFLRSGQLSALLILPSCAPAVKGGTAPVIGTKPKDDRFFLQIMPSSPGGWDNSYLFDARPLAMTQAKLIQNYLGKEPAPWTGDNGGTTWASSLTDPLREFHRYFSIVNGVHMSTIDGHDQNFNYLLTGDALGGKCFVPYFNRTPTLTGLPLDGIQRGRIQATLTNTSQIAALTMKSMTNLLAGAKSEPVIDAADPLHQYVAGRFAALSQGSEGAFSSGADAMKTAMAQMGDLSQRLRGIKIETGDHEDVPSFLSLVFQAFRAKIARSAVVILDGSNTTPLYDTHDAVSAKKQPQTYAGLVQTLAQTFRLLRDTPYDDKRSMMDVTTFLISAEFGRTMRQSYAPFESTGTDHNPASNQLLVGGKGIRGGLVLGESDFRTQDETLSPAHLTLDPARAKIMGRPFDFTMMKPKPILPQVMAASDYLNAGSVINTLLSSFGVSPDAYFPIERNAGPCPILSPLLA